MLRLFTIISLFFTASAVTLPASACDMHGGGFGFGNPTANWQSYNPRSYTTDPALLGLKDIEASAIKPIPPQKTRPSFSNAANRAALIAKSRVAQKAKDKAVKASKDEAVKKAALGLNADR